MADTGYVGNVTVHMGMQDRQRTKGSTCAVEEPDDSGTATSRWHAEGRGEGIYAYLGWLIMG
jgi:hypothetical protein